MTKFVWINIEKIKESVYIADMRMFEDSPYPPTSSTVEKTEALWNYKRLKEITMVVITT